MNTDSPQINNSGHRQRLRKQFTSASTEMSEVELVELLLTYAIPRRNVAPLASELLQKFGTISNLLAASRQDLVAIVGIGDQAAALVRLVAVLTERASESEGAQSQAGEESRPDEIVAHSGKATTAAKPTTPTKRRKTAARTFTNDLAQAALDYLPHAPEYQTIESYEKYLLEALPYNSANSRKRYTSNLINRYFADGAIKRPLTLFLDYESTPASMEAAIFYETVAVESALKTIAEKGIWPALPAGKLSRAQLRSFLISIFPDVTSSTIQRMLYSVVNTYSILNGARADKEALYFQIREGTLPAFLYLLCAQFPKPGIYTMDALEAGPMRRWLLWDREWMRKQLYNLQDLGIVAKVSEIDTIRQFTLTYDQTDALNYFYHHSQHATIALREKHKA